MKKNSIELRVLKVSKNAESYYTIQFRYPNSWFGGKEWEDFGSTAKGGYQTGVKDRYETFEEADVMCKKIITPSDTIVMAHYSQE